MTKNIQKVFLSILTLFLLFPLSGYTDEKPFVIIIPSHNNKEWYQKNLDSVFHQKYSNYRIIYIADAPTDGSGKLAYEYIAENHQEKRVTFLENTERNGTLACMCRGAFTCSKDEIIVDLEGCDWLVHDEVLRYLNSVYADPDIWMTYGQFLYYPMYTQGFASSIPENVIRNNEFRNLSGCVSHLRTFYAALFHEIDKQDFILDRHFFKESGDLAYILPLLEMSGQHTRFTPELLYMFNYTFPASNHRADSELGASIDKIIRHKNKYFPLPELPITPIAPPASIYRRINDITHPTPSDYRFVQAYLTKGKRDSLEKLGDMQNRIREMKIIGNSSDENPSTGILNINCGADDLENCVIIYTSFNRNYPEGLRRLLQHITASDYKGHILYRIGGWPDEEGGSLALSHIPYAFKPCLFKEAQKLGYKRVLWLDASVTPVASLNEIFAMIEEKSYFAMGNSHMIGPYMTPQAAAYFGLTLSQTHLIPSCSSGLFGLDLTQEKPKLLLDLWYRAASDKDAFFTPRPDQNSLSILLHQFHFSDLIDLSRVPHAEIGEPVQPDSLFYLDRLFVSIKHIENAQAPPKKISITPGFWGELFAIDNPIFNRDNCLEVLYRLRETARGARYEIYQANDLETLQDSDYIIVFDVFLDQLERLKHYPKEKKILFLWEPPSVIPENYVLENHRDFSKVYTWHDGLVDNQKYFKFYYPVIRPMITDIPNYHSKELCTLIACNKESHFPGELYSERRNLIQFYENTPHNDFTLYGKWWPPSLRNYAGPIDKKVDTLKHFRFCYAYENIRNVPGYITEKIFDCFQAGTVPIYWGAPNISSYIPKNCYISREDFPNDTALHSYIKNMDEMTYQEYQENIRRYLESSQAQLYSQDHFISLFMHLISNPETKL